MKKTILLSLLILFVGGVSAFGDTPPYSDALQYHDDFEVNPWGILKHANSNSSINLTTGRIHHNAWVDSKFLSGIGIGVIDAIYSDFSVPTSGYYSMTCSGNISGGFWNVSSTLIIGAAKGGGELWLESQITQFPSSKFRKTLHQTDLSAGALVETLAETTIWSLVGIGDFVGALNTVKSLAVPEASWNSSTDSFSMTSYVYLQAGQSYRWLFTVNSATASASLGAACNVTTFDVDVNLEGVNIKLINPQGNDPLLYNGWVHPRWGGTTETAFEYVVDYLDFDGDAPEYVKVYIDDNYHDMTLYSGTAASGTYRFYPVHLDTGNHDFYFKTTDSRGGTTTTDRLNGPDVDVPLPGSFDVIGYTLDDSTSICYRNDGDGDFQSSEQIHIRPRIQYNGMIPATDIDVTILYEGTELEITQGDRRYPDLGDGDSAYPENNGYFWVHSVDYGFTGTINLDVQVDWDESSTPIVIHDAIQLDVKPAPVLNVTPGTWDFGVAPPGDNITHKMYVHNRGSDVMTITDVQTSNADTSVSPGDKSFTLAPRTNRDILITINTDSIPNGTTISREIQVISNTRLLEESPPSDQTVITGLVSHSTPTFQVPNSATADDPDISGEWIVYENYGNDIYAFQITSGADIQITNDPAVQWSPLISGNLIVWTDNRNWDGQGERWEQNDIYGYDLGTGQEFIISNDPAHERLIGVDNGKVAFGRVYHEITEPSEGDTKLYNLWLYDYGTKISTNVTGFTSNTSHNPMHTIWTGDADFGNDLLVWHERTMQWTTHIYDHWEITDAHADKMQIGVDSSGVRVLEHADYPYPLAAAGTRFVWLNDDDKVSLWDQGAKQQITSEDGDNDALAIGDSFIVYRKWGQQEVFYWDISKNQEFLLTDQVYDAEAIRMDGNGVVWWGHDPNSQWHIYYTFLHQPEIAVASANLTFSVDTPYEGTVIDVNCLVCNLSNYDLTDDITVRLYDGHPDIGTQLGSDVVISGGIAAKDCVTVTFSNIPVGIEGTHNISVCIYVPGFDNPANNKATKTLIVRDSDTQGPVISNVVVQEFNGNGDGRIEDDEQVLISWQANDISGINSSWCTIDANDFAASGTYYVIVGPFTSGTYEFIISATDGDISSETSDFYDRFRVHTCDLFSDGVVNFLDYAILARNWLNSCLEPDWCEGADLNSSGEVNIADFSIFTDKWLTGI